VRQEDLTPDTPRTWSQLLATFNVGDDARWRCVPKLEGDGIQSVNMARVHDKQLRVRDSKRHKQHIHHQQLPVDEPEEVERRI
jgi:hypothetical protein